MWSVAASVGHKVSMEVDDNILLIVGDPQGILDQQLSPHPFYLFKFFKYINYFLNDAYYATIPSVGRNESLKMCSQMKKNIELGLCNLDLCDQFD